MDRFLGSKKLYNTIVIEEEELNHIYAKRVKSGQKVEVFIEGRLYLCILEKLTKSYASCLIEKELDLSFPLPMIDLYQCVPVELKNMDLIVEKVSEVGAFKLVPVISSRSFQDIKVIKKKIERWERIALASFKQCKRPKPLQIGEPINLKDIKAQADLNLFLDSFEKERGIKDIKLDGVKTIQLLVGPEGGLTVKESEFLKSLGFLPLRLYPYVLKSETASILGVGMLMNLSSYSSATYQV
ncbi:16S rRNA (uracil(1498)-N(3))-methyltransferase [Thermocrinis sp.]|uniref:RsmE family RNA methyltransferase n=1 Tax=Thermocrinis sp. TaxID=2024383 RepID=UPI002FDDB71D